RLAGPADAGGSIDRVAARAVGRERAAVAVAVEVGPGQGSVRAAGGGGEDGRDLEVERQAIDAAQHEAVALVVAGRPFLLQRIEAQRQAEGIGRVPPQALVLDDRGALDV